MRQGAIFSLRLVTSVSLFCVVVFVGVAEVSAASSVSSDSARRSYERGVTLFREGNAFGMAEASAWSGHARPHPVNPANTTISVVVTNARLPWSDLQRLALQVHGSMGRAIQPFATAWDGDVLFAVSTDEVPLGSLHAIELGTLASEVMWDALLTAHTPRAVRAPRLLPPAALAGLQAGFGFDRHSSLAVHVAGEQLMLEVTGDRPVYGLAKGSRVDARLLPDGRFVCSGPGAGALRDGGFCGDDGQVGALVVNLGVWQQFGRRLPG